VYINRIEGADKIEITKPNLSTHPAVTVGRLQPSSLSAAASFMCLLVRYFLHLTSLCKLHTIVCRRDTIGDQNETLDEKQGRTIEIVFYQP